METLRDRCKAMIDELNRNTILRQGSPVDDLLAFVIAERGRAADEALEPTLPLCLYFASNQDREEFMVAMREAKPGMMMKKLP
jgi:hypothetical protein